MKKMLSLLALAAPLGLVVPAHAQSTTTPPPSNTSSAASTDTKPAPESGGIKEGIKKDAQAVKSGTKKAWSKVKSGSKKAWTSTKKGAHDVKTDAKSALKGDGSQSVNKPVGNTGSEPTAGSAGH